VFFTITLPLAKRGVLAGARLTLARAPGEFGATIKRLWDRENESRAADPDPNGLNQFSKNPPFPGRPPDAASAGFLLENKKGRADARPLLFFHNPL